MSGGSAPRPRSTTTTSSSRRRTCCRAPAPRPGCSTSSTAASITSWSTRRRTPARSSGRSSRRWPRSSSPARARATSCARCSPSATRSSRSTASRAPTRRGSARSAAPSGSGPRRRDSSGTSVPLDAVVPLDRADPRGGRRVFARAGRGAGAHLAGGERSSSTRLPQGPGGAGRALGGRGRAEARAGRCLRALERGGRRRAPVDAALPSASPRTIKGWLDSGERLPAERPPGAGRRHPDPGARAAIRSPRR